MHYVPDRVVPNPFPSDQPYFVDEGTATTKRADPGCVVIYEDVIHTGHTRYKRICLTGDSKVQTLQFSPSQLGIPREYVSVVAGKDTFVTFFQGNEPIVSMSEWQFFHTNEHKYYDRIHVAYLKDPIFSDTQRTMVEVTGNVITPPPCITMSSEHPYEKSDAKSLTICGKSGRIIYHSTKAKLRDNDVDLAFDKFDGILISYVEAGLLATLDIWSELTYSGQTLRFHNSVGDLYKKPFRLQDGTISTWADEIESFQCTFK